MRILLRCSTLNAGSSWIDFNMAEDRSLTLVSFAADDLLQCASGSCQLANCEMMSVNDNMSAISSTANQGNRVRGQPRVAFWTANQSCLIGGFVWPIIGSAHPRIRALGSVGMSFTSARFETSGHCARALTANQVALIRGTYNRSSDSPP